MPRTGSGQGTPVTPFTPTVDTGIAYDIKQAYIEVGIAYTVYRNNVALSVEYGLPADNRQVTKPFIRESFLEVSIPYDTLAESGDVLHFSDDRDFLLMSKSPFLVENQAVEFTSVLYKSNCSGELKRPSGEADWDAQYQKQTRFQTIGTTCYALITESLFHDDMQDLPIGEILDPHNILYIPRYYGSKVNDRYEPVSGEYYRIKTIKSHGFLGIDVCSIEEDTR